MHGPRQARQAKGNGGRRDAAATTTGNSNPPPRGRFLDARRTSTASPGYCSSRPPTAESAARCLRNRRQLRASNFLARLLKTAGDDGAVLTSASARASRSRALAGTCRRTSRGRPRARPGLRRVCAERRHAHDGGARRWHRGRKQRRRGGRAALPRQLGRRRPAKTRDERRRRRAVTSFRDAPSEAWVHGDVITKMLRRRRS